MVQSTGFRRIRLKTSSHFHSFEADDRAQRAINAYRVGSLASESFDSITQDGKQYRITNG
jgi:hypothetical protein